MKLLKINHEVQEIYVNVESISAIVKEKENFTKIYLNGNLDYIYAHENIDTLIKKIEYLLTK